MTQEHDTTILGKILAIGLGGLLLGGIEHMVKNADNLAPILKDTIRSSDDITTRAVVRSSDNIVSKLVVKNVPDIIDETRTIPRLGRTDNVEPLVPLKKHVGKNDIVQPSHGRVNELAADIVVNAHEEFIYSQLEQIRQRTLVTQAQERLRESGFDPGPLDGILDPKTRKALRYFQYAYGLPITGELDADTLQALGIF